MVKVILDCDNTMGLPFHEVDDGLALLYLLGVPEIELLGITTTFGNSRQRAVYRQTSRLITALGVDIPVFEGARRSKKEQVTQSARFLVETSRKYAGELNIIATGPMGNLLAAQTLDGAFFSRCRQILCMGGYFSPLKIGRINLGELNFSADPKAAYQVLTAPCPVTVMSGQICTQASLNRADIDQLAFWSPAFRTMLKCWLGFFGTAFGTKAFYLWDLLPAIYCTHPNLFNEALMGFASTVHDLQKGRIVISSDASLKQVNFPSQIVNKENFFVHLIQAWQNSAKQFPI